MLIIAHNSNIWLISTLFLNMLLESFSLFSLVVKQSHNSSPFCHTKLFGKLGSESGNALLMFVVWLNRHVSLPYM